ncbi:MAG: CAP domain-containing protein [Polyangiales bacterium]
MRIVLLAATFSAAACSSCASPQRPADVARPRPAAPAVAVAVERDPAALAVVAEVQAAAAAEGLRVAPDAALDATARALLDRVRAAPEHRTPSAPVIQALAWRAGVIDPIPAVVVVRRSAGAASESSRQGMRDLMRSERPTHLGVALARLDGDELIVLTLTRRRATLAAVTPLRRVGDTLALRGALDDDLRDPVLVVTRPDGTTRERPLAQGAAIDAELTLDARGAWQVELMASSAQGSTVVANFPVYVDAPAPEVPADTSASPPGEPAAVAEELRALLDDARRRAGLGPLVSSRELAAVAQAHSDDMSANGFVAHVSPTTGGPGDRLRRAGFLAPLALENVARGYAAREIHEGLMASPGHRANILHAEATHVGVAVSRERGGSGLLATQVFAALPRPVEPAAAAAGLLRAINAARRGRGLAELSERSQLQAAAAAAARTYFERPEFEQQQVFQQAARAVQRDAALFRRVSVAGAFGPRAAGVDELPSVLEPELRAIGVAVAQGDRPHQPAGSVLTVVVTAVPR